MKAVFLIGTMDRTAKLKSNPSPLLDSNMQLLQEVEEQCGLDATVVFTIEDKKFAGREKDVKLKHIRKERDRVVTEISQVNPELVICFGRKALDCAFNKGSNTLEANRRRLLDVGDFGGRTHVCDSLSRAVYQPGIRKWIRMDCLAAVRGQTSTVWGDYNILQPGTPEWGVLPHMLDGWEHHSKIGFDLETFPGTDPWHQEARIRMAMFSIKEGEAVVVQCTPDSRLPDWAAKILRADFVGKCGSFISFDKRWCDRFGYEVRNIKDTVLAEHVIDCTDPNNDLKNLSLRYVPRLGVYDRDLHDLIKSRGKKDDWHLLEDHEMYTYAGADAEASLAAAEAQEIIIMTNGLGKPWRLACDTQEVLAKMYIRGMAVDKTTTLDLDEKMGIHLTDLRSKICEVLGPFNPGSPVQLANTLKDFLPNIDLRVNQWRKILGDDEDEDVSTSREILMREADKHPIIKDVLEFRKWNKMHGSFVKAFLEKHIVNHGGCDYIHPGYKMSAETDRLTSSNPNAQQFPRKGEEPTLNVKRQIISRFKDGVLLNADYAQMEVRIAAMLSGDQALIDALLAEDIHKATAALMMRKNYKDITPDERQAAKTIGFATMYGAGANNISKQLGIHKDEAKELMGMYFTAYPKLRQYIDKVHHDVKKDLRVETPFGFRRDFVRPHGNNWNQHSGFKIQRQAFNTIIQGTAACVMYCALINIEKEIESMGMESLLLSTTHDSGLGDTFPGELDALKDVFRRNMASPGTEKYGVEITVPLAVDLEVGINWGAMEEVS